MGEASLEEFGGRGFWGGRGGGGGVGGDEGQPLDGEGTIIVTVTRTHRSLLYTTDLSGADNT